MKVDFLPGNLSGSKYSVLCQLLSPPSSLTWFRIPGRGSSGSHLHPRVREAASSLPPCPDRSGLRPSPYVSVHVQNVQTFQLPEPRKAAVIRWGCGHFLDGHKQEILLFFGPRILGEKESEHVVLSDWDESGVHQELGPHGPCEVREQMRSCTDILSVCVVDHGYSLIICKCLPKLPRPVLPFYRVWWEWPQDLTWA